LLGAAVPKDGHSREPVECLCAAIDGGAECGRELVWSAILEALQVVLGNLVIEPIKLAHVSFGTA